MTIEKTLFAAADKMRGSMDPGEYKHVALGLLFLRYISIAFQRKYDELLPEGQDVAEDVDEYMADGIFWVPEAARWKTLSAQSKDPNPNLLAKVVQMLDEIPMDDRDTKGDVFEYMLGKIASAGQNGQFRTPRHIINLMVHLMAPTPKDVICDPAVGTCGFLVAAGEYLRDHHPTMLRDPDQRQHFHNGMFHGFGFAGLSRQMRHERAAIDRLGLDRYILATSVSLTPTNKWALAEIIGPSLKSLDDLLGFEDLNGLLREHHDVAKAHVKLWLSDKRPQCGLSEHSLRLHR